MPILMIGTSIVNTSAQQPSTPLQNYIDTAESLVIARCLAEGPVDILLRSDVELEVIHVVKGDPKMKSLRVRLSGGLSKGEIYLIRFADHAKSKEKNGFGSEGANIVPVSRYEDLELLKKLSPRIVVLRTMNRRIDELESIIRRSTFELEGLKAVKASD